MFGHLASGVWSSCGEEIQSEPAAKLNVGPLWSSSTAPFQTEGQRWAALTAYDWCLFSFPALEQECLTVTAGTACVSTNLTWDMLL